MPCPPLVALAIVPLSEPRLRFARTAAADGLIQIGATVTAVAMAALGSRAASLVVPPLASQLAKGDLLPEAGRHACDGRTRLVLHAKPLEAHIPAAAGKYAHGATVFLATRGGHLRFRVDVAGIAASPKCSPPRP